MIFELVPHQNPSQIGMAFEVNAIKIKNFALLKFRAAPDRRERRQPRALSSISGAHSNDHRSMFVGYRIKVINRLEIARNFLLGRLINFFLHALDDCFYFYRFLHDPIEPIDARDIGTKIEPQGRIDAQKSCSRYRMLVINQKRILLRRAAVRNDFNLRPRHISFDAGFYLIQRFHH